MGGDSWGNGLSETAIAPSVDGPTAMATTVSDDENVRGDLCALNKWAIRRYHYRMRNGALDAFLRHKTELHLGI